jgi:Cu(I)/Ag(I) efflux system membrane protein CusA/SilA
MHLCSKSNLSRLLFIFFLKFVITTFVYEFRYFGEKLRDLFQMGTINLGVAVRVGFLPLFGITIDDGIIFCIYLQQTFKRNKPQSISMI